MTVIRDAVALVPIKANSNRVPRKNFRPFLGRPLFHYILETLDGVDAVTEIIVNTDSETITTQAPRVSRKVRIHPRPPELCGDHVSVSELIAHDIGKCEGELFIQTHVTNQLLRGSTIETALTTYLASSTDHDSMFSVTRHQARFYNSAGAPMNHNPRELLPTQDLPPMSEDNSLLYVFSRESFLLDRRRIGRSPMMYPAPPLESIDIDTEDQLWLAAVVARALEVIDREVTCD